MLDLIIFGEMMLLKLVQHGLKYQVLEAQAIFVISLLLPRIVISCMFHGMIIAFEEQITQPVALQLGQTLLETYPLQMSPLILK